MKIRIIGSGGCVSTPRPCCNCPICVEAREKGFPYARTGCSLEEDWGKSYDDYKELEKQYENVRFAYDGLELYY